jgi:hypothetical protein
MEKVILKEERTIISIKVWKGLSLLFRKDNYKKWYIGLFHTTKGVRYAIHSHDFSVALLSTLKNYPAVIIKLYK